MFCLGEELFFREKWLDWISENFREKLNPHHIYTPPNLGLSHRIIQRHMIDFYQDFGYCFNTTNLVA